MDEDVDRDILGKSGVCGCSGESDTREGEGIPEAQESDVSNVKEGFLEVEGNVIVAVGVKEGGASSFSSPWLLAQSEC